MKKPQFPTAQTILLAIAAFVAILTWFIPAGNYNTLSYVAEENAFLVKSEAESKLIPAEQSVLDELNVKIPLEKFTNGDIYKPISIPKTYNEVEPRPQGFSDFIQSPIKGIIAAADIIFLVLIIGGLIGIMNLTGAFDAGIAWLAKALKGREYLLIILTTTLVALGGTTFGLAEETLAFFPILIPVFIAAKYDAMVGLACIFLGSSIGTMCSTINPFSTIIASDAAGIHWTTGIEGRIIMFLLCLSIAIIYILQYAKKVKKDPRKSLVYNQHQTQGAFGVLEETEPKQLTARLRLILFVFISCFVVMIFGVSQLGWWFVEMTSVFLCGAIVIGILAGINEKDFVNSFSSGAGDLLGVAFIIGIARGVSILMDDGLISDTVLYHASSLTEGMDKGLFINSLFFVYNGLAFLIPSSSGMAVLTMPVMSPLADTVGIGRELIVNAYLYGMGLFSIINPTGMILASLAIVKIGYDKWLKFIWPLVVILILVTVAVLSISVYLN